MSVPTSSGAFAASHVFRLPAVGLGSPAGLDRGEGRAMGLFAVNRGREKLCRKALCRNKLTNSN